MCGLIECGGLGGGDGTVDGSFDSGREGGAGKSTNFGSRLPALGSGSLGFESKGETTASESWAADPGLEGTDGDVCGPGSWGSFSESGSGFPGEISEASDGVLPRPGCSASSGSETGGELSGGELSGEDSRGAESWNSWLSGISVVLE